MRIHRRAGFAFVYDNALRAVMALGGNVTIYVQGKRTLFFIKNT